MAAAIPGRSATITWGLPQNIAIDADVSTAGTLVGAYSLGAAGIANKVVNGVTFVGVVDTASPTVFGDFSVTGPSNGSNSLYQAWPFGLSAAYESLLTSGIYSFALPFTLSMSNLVPGTAYEFQWWLNENSLSGTNTIATAGNSVNLVSTVGPGPFDTLDSLPGQFAIGTFVADASTTQSIDFSTGYFTQLNAFQLRQLSGVPDSGSSLALFALSVFGLMASRRAGLCRAVRRGSQ